jgi:hypothetical protein
MANLSDTQRILLSTASQRDNGSILPLPACITPGGGAAKAIAALLKRSLAEERETSEPTLVHRRDADVCYGVFISVVGAAAIGVDAGDVATESSALVRPEADAAPSPSLSPKASSKTVSVLALLRRPDGATLAQLIELTGWLPHTTRAALTGIRKKGHDVARFKRDGATCYRIVEQA